LSARHHRRPRSNDETQRARLAGPVCVEIVAFLPIHYAIAKALGPRPLAVPPDGEQQLRAAIDALSEHVEIHSDLPGDTTPTPQAGQSRPTFVLRRLEQGLAITARVRPAGPEGPSIPPGRGATTVVAQIDGNAVRATRDLRQERDQLEEVLAGCPMLLAGRTAEDQFVLGTRDDALEGLAELHTLGERVGLQWPEGQTLHLCPPVGLEQLRHSIQHHKGAFLAQGHVSVPGQGRIQLLDLADYLAASPSRFLARGDQDCYVALTSQLRARLDELLALGERSKRGLRFHPLAAPLVAGAVDSAHIETDEAWQRRIERWGETDDEPGVPSTFRGNLRPYKDRTVIVLGLRRPQHQQ